jgi:hypothetical protein
MYTLGTWPLNWCGAMCPICTFFTQKMSYELAMLLTKHINPVTASSLEFGYPAFA